MEKEMVPVHETMEMLSLGIGHLNLGMKTKNQN